MSVLFESLLSRADDHTLQQLLGQSPVRLIRLLSDESMSLDRLRKALMSLRSPAELLLNRESRHHLTGLLRPDEARTLGVLLGTRGVDHYQQIGEVAISRGSLRERDMLSYFGVPVPDRSGEVVPPDSESVSSSYPLFAHQRSALQRVKAAVAREPRRVLLHMPTGAGKTRVAMNLICDHLRANEPDVVIWLAHSEELCDQASGEFFRAWQAMGNRDLTIHRFWGPHNLDLASVSDGLVIAGLSKLFSAARERIAFVDKLRRRSSLIVMDEAHQSVADTYAILLDVLLASGDTSLVGLTATPGRTWDDHAEDERLARYFGRKKVTLKVEGYANPIQYLVNEGYLAKPTFGSVFYNPGFALTGADLAAIQMHFDIPESIVKRLADDEQRNLAVLKQVESLAKRHQRILVFAASVEHSLVLAAVLKARGVEAASVTGQTAPEERNRIIGAFRSDSPTPMVLCNFGVLTTGFDAPRTSAAVIARPTRSLVLYSQMIGRAIRGRRAGGNDSAEILIVQDSQLPGFGDVGEAFLNWEDVWNEES